MQYLNEGVIALVLVGKGLNILCMYYSRINDVFQVGTAEILVRKYKQVPILNRLIGFVPDILSVFSDPHKPDYPAAFPGYTC